MIHFLYLISFAVLVAIVFAAIHSGTVRDKALYGLKVFAQFVVISLALAWVFYFIP
jgi:hypothetical protein